MEIRTCPRCHKVLDGQGYLAADVFKPMADWHTLWLNKPVFSKDRAMMLLGTLKKCEF
jgi:hypothetical protein